MNLQVEKEPDQSQEEENDNQFPAYPPLFLALALPLILYLFRIQPHLFPSQVRYGSSPCGRMGIF
jgi:hypothetical protein